MLIIRVVITFSLVWFKASIIVYILLLIMSQEIGIYVKWQLREIENLNTFLFI